MDEPEVALSPHRHLSFIVLHHDLMKGNESIQFIIATQSPIWWAYLGEQIFSFDEGKIQPIVYRDSWPFKLVSRSMGAPE